MNGFLNIVTCIATLGLAALIGFLCVKTHYLPKEVLPSVSKLVVRLTLPILIVTSLTKTELTPEKLLNCFAIVICGLAVIGFLMLIGFFCEKLFPKSAPPVTHRCMTAFGNVVFIAYPLIQSLYGTEGLFYATIFVFANDAWLWTYAVFSLSKQSGRSASLTSSLKKLINPSSIAFTLSFILMLFGVKFTGIAGDVLNGIGSTTTYISMIYIGGILAGVNLRGILRRPSHLVLAFIKLIAVPVLLIFALKITPLSETVRGVIVLQAAMPVSTVLVMLCSEYGGDADYSAEGVFITTLLSLGTLPLIYSLMSLL